jgi:hypothetical protein
LKDQKRTSAKREQISLQNMWQNSIISFICAGKENSFIRTLQWCAFNFCEGQYLPISLCNRSNTRVNISHSFLICAEDDALFL